MKKFADYFSVFMQHPWRLIGKRMVAKVKREPCTQYRIVFVPQSKLYLQSTPTRPWTRPRSPLARHFRRISRRPRNGKRLFPRPKCLSRLCFARVFPSLKVVYPLHVSDNNARSPDTLEAVYGSRNSSRCVYVSRVDLYHAFVRFSKNQKLKVKKYS